MGQVQSSPSIRVMIVHKFSPKPPSGWAPGGTVSFHTKQGDVIGHILQKLNEYRSPNTQISHLCDENGITLSHTTPILGDEGNVTYYV